MAGALSVDQQKAVALSKARMSLASSAPSGEDDESLSFGEIATATGEVALTFGTGAFATALGGVLGLTEGIAAGIAGAEDPVAEAERRISEVMEARTFQPRTEPGQELLGIVGEPFQDFEQLATRGGDTALDVTGSPAAATVVKTGIESIPDLLGLKGPRSAAFGKGDAPTGAQRRADVRGVERSAEKEGIDLNADKFTQERQVRVAARLQVGAERKRQGQDLQRMQDKIVQEKDRAKGVRNDLYAQARRKRAGLPTQEARRFEAIARESLEGFDIANLPLVKARMDELAALGKPRVLPPREIDIPLGKITVEPKIKSVEERFVQIRDLEIWRKSINRNKPVGDDATQAAALGILKGQYDNFMDAAFDADMISGDPTAIAAWKRARKENIYFERKFGKRSKRDRAGEAIKRLADEEVTPEELRSWIFGANAIGGKTEAGGIVIRLKEILGEDSPQFTALRQEALLDIAAPLLQKKPDFDKFLANVEKLDLKKPTMAKELFPESVSSIRELRDLVRGIKEVADAEIGIDLERGLAVMIFGHQIAKKSLIVRTATSMTKILRGAAGPRRKRAIMAEILGYDALAPAIPKLPAFIGGSVQTGIGTGEDDQPQGAGA